MLQLATIFQDGMILQRDKRIAIWGTAESGKQISVSIQGQTSNANTDEKGNWKAYLEPLETVSSTELIVSDGENEITVSDVAIGDVYIAGGQSNMEFLMRYEKHISNERDLCGNKDIRFFDVPEIAYDGQDKDFDYSNVGIWRKATPEDIDFFSAPAYYFAKELNAKLDIPIGIVGLNWGGTRTSSWMKEESANAVCPDLVAEFERKLNGKSYEELISEASCNPMNDRGYSKWEPFSEMMMPKTPTAEEVKAFFSNIAQVAELDNFLNNAMPVEKPGCLYEYMVKPTAPFSVKGVIWYQGESDAEIPEAARKYEQALSTMIRDWREAWDDELPFFIVQLPGFESWLETKGELYPLIRDAQKNICDKDDNAYLCSISDVGEQFDIHPKDKKTVGHRLSLLALKYLYGQDIVADAPVPRDVTRNDNEVEITFDNAGDGLHADGKQIDYLEVSQEGKELDFNYRIDSNKLVIELRDAKSTKVDINFAYRDWFKVNLYNSAGVPTVPFKAGRDLL